MPFKIDGIRVGSFATGLLLALLVLVVGALALLTGRTPFEAVVVAAAVAIGLVVCWLRRDAMRERGVWWLLASFGVSFAGFWMLFGVSIEPAQGVALVFALFIVAVWMFKRGINRFWSEDDRT